MPWWDKGLKTVRDQAEKGVFEANKLVRVQREEGVSAELRGKIQGKIGELGQAALELCRSGALKDPALLALVGEITGLEDQLKQQDAKIEAIRAEQWQGGEGGAPSGDAGATAETIKIAMPEPAGEASAAPEVGGTPAGAPASAAAEVSSAPVEPPTAPAPAPAAGPELVECPSCHTQVRSSAAFCPECGTKLK